jgi:hypothetical protein
LHYTAKPLAETPRRSISWSIMLINCIAKIDFIIISVKELKFKNKTLLSAVGKIKDA